MLCEAPHHRLESEKEDALWRSASDRIFESRVSDFARRTSTLPSEGTRIVIARFITAALPEAKKAHRPLRECPHLLTCLCREHTLLGAAAYEQARVSGENPHALVDEWMADLNRYLQGLS